jgi:FxsC-like protein
MSYFFLSRAEDDDDFFIERFFADLSTEVRNRAEVVRPDEVGFLDTPPDGGPRWSTDISRALTTCQTFVALCSGRYFLSDRCGRAWGVFADRLRRHELATGVRVPALIPVVWSSDGLPPDAFEHDGLDLVPHRTPGDEDLRVLLRVRSNRIEYRAFVTSLARRVVEVAQAYRLPPAPIGTDLDAARNVFELNPRWVGATEKPRTVHFVVAAGTRAQMQTVRADTHFYGDRPEDWAPFAPAATQPLAVFARGAAAQRMLAPDVVSLDLLHDRVSVARERNDIVVVLVDAWATRLDSFRSSLADLAKYDDDRVAVLVTASADDPETARHRDELRVAVAQTLADRSGRDALTGLDVTSVKGFTEILGGLLAEAQRRLYHSGHVFRRAAARPVRSRPILGGP